MKKLRKYFIPAVMFIAFANSCHASASGDGQTIKCTPAPCQGTPTGGDPNVLRLRLGNKIKESLRNSDDDAMRWAGLFLFSDSSEKDDLTIPIIKESKFFMTLDPKKGILHFHSPNSFQYFRIDTGEPHEPGEICPKYQLRILDATSEYALLKKICPKQEYEPKHFYMASTYYIYDMKSATVREIWSGSKSIDIDAPFPSAKPEISLKRTKDGYQFDWVGMSVSDNPTKLWRIHRTYKRETEKNGKLYLACYDTTRRQHPIKENDTCESEILQRILP